MNQQEVIAIIVIVLALGGTFIGYSMWQSFTERGEQALAEFKEAGSIENLDERLEAQNNAIDKLTGEAK